jgi:protein transport protein SEC24
MMSCTGPALNAAKRVIQNVGGKVMLFQTSLPSIGEGTLKPRENPRMLGTDKEHMLLNAEESWYKNTAIEFSRLQICIDVFLFSSQYTDVATFSVLSKFTAGSTYYYPGFYGPRDGEKFEAELERALTRACAFEAVMRVRATRGLRIQNFYGSFFIRGTDLLALPNCHADSVYTMDFAYDEPTLSTTAVTVQAALLYTNSAGERRIRVHTMVIPVTQSLSEMLSLTDIDCTVNISAKQAVDTSLKGGLDASRTRVHQNCVEILRAAKSGVQQQQMPGQYGGPGGYQQAPASGGSGEVPVALQLLPLYSMSLQKNLALRGGADVRTDERAFFMSLVANMDIEESKVFIYPRMFSVHDMSMDAGTSSDNADDVPTAGASRVRLPSILNLSHERLTTDGMFLLENGYDLFLWIGRNVNPAILDTLFGVSSLENADMSQLKILSENSDFSNRFNAIVEALRDERTRFLQLHFIREGDGYAEAYFSRFLVEDR